MKLEVITAVSMKVCNVINIGFLTFGQQVCGIFLLRSAFISNINFSCYWMGHKQKNFNYWIILRRASSSHKLIHGCRWSLVECYQHFQWSYCLHLLGMSLNSKTAYSFPLYMNLTDCRVCSELLKSSLLSNFIVSCVNFKCNGGVGRAGIWRMQGEEIDLWFKQYMCVSNKKMTGMLSVGS
jgi:hypothetical protein